MRRVRGDLEGAVIDVLGSRGALSVADVRAALDADLAYTTVMTVLVRLVEKGTVSRERVGRAHRYALVAAPHRLPALQAALRMRRELDGSLARAEVLSSFVASLSDEDEALLRAVLSSGEEGGEQ